MPTRVSLLFALCAFLPAFAEDNSRGYMIIQIGQSSRGIMLAKYRAPAFGVVSCGRSEITAGKTIHCRVDRPKALMAGPETFQVILPPGWSGPEQLTFEPPDYFALFDLVVPPDPEPMIVKRLLLPGILRSTQAGLDAGGQAAYIHLLEVYETEPDLPKP